MSDYTDKVRFGFALLGFVLMVFCLWTWVKSPNTGDLRQVKTDTIVYPLDSAWDSVVVIQHY